MPSTDHHGGDQEELEHVGQEGHGSNATRRGPGFPGGTLEAWIRTEPGAHAPARAPVAAAPAAGPPKPWQPGIPSVREHLPSVLFGGVLPIGVYFIARNHVHGDTPALIIAGCVSARLGAHRVRPPAHGRRRRGRRPARLRRRRDHVAALRRQRLHAQGARRVPHAVVRHRLHRDALHPRPPGLLLRQPLLLRRQRPGQGVGLRPAARRAAGPPHLPHAVGDLGHRPGGRCLVTPGARRDAAHRHLHRRLPVHHGQRARQPGRLHRGVHEADRFLGPRRRRRRRRPLRSPAAKPGPPRRVRRSPDRGGS